MAEAHMGLTEADPSVEERAGRAPASKAPAVALHGVSKRYENVLAVDDLTIEVADGEFFALLGPSGCGKTTTMKMIAGLLRPSGGDIQFDGSSMTGIAAERRGAVMLFQNYLLFPYMSAAENVGFGLKMRGEDTTTIRRKVSEILELVRLPGVENRRPKQLSGGQQQRVALARALIVGPKVLLMDEPLSNLDAHLRDEMRELIRGIQRQWNMTTIFVTHDQEEAVVLADKVALMFHGALQQYAEPSVFYECPASASIARFFGGLNFLPGVVRGRTMTTPLGEFIVSRPAVSDGPATLTIRPEAIVLGDNTANTVRGRVVSHVYVGTHTRYKVAVGEHELTVVTAPEAVRLYHDGDEVALHLPPDKVWLLPPE
jgi:ABC-type Fe3+/spermidine/putrescine transport system ATPase subunit